MNIFDFDDYFIALRTEIGEQEGLRGYLSRMANAVGCQKSYLSQVVKGKAHFTPEHAVRLASFWNLNDSGREYLLQLVILGRTDFQPLQSMIRARMAAIKKERESLAQRFKESSIQDEKSQMLYYSSWIPSALHVAVDVPELRSTKALVQHFALPESVVSQQLAMLEELGLIKRQGHGWAPTGRGLHLPRESIFTLLNHQNWRDRALLASRKLEGDSIHYTGVQTLSGKDFETIKNLILQFIDKQRNLVGPSNPEVPACLTLDWFKI